MWTGSSATVMPSLFKMCLMRYMIATDRCLPDLHHMIKCRGFPGEPWECVNMGNASCTSLGVDDKTSIHSYTQLLN